jgi:hypothetical protein
MAGSLRPGRLGFQKVYESSACKFSLEIQLALATGAAATFFSI